MGSPRGAGRDTAFIHGETAGLAIMPLDPTGKGQARWTMRWKTALNAFDGRLSAARQQPTTTPDIPLVRQTRSWRSHPREARAEPWRQSPRARCVGVPSLLRELEQRQFTVPAACAD
ncbi:hypothetical protein ABZX90_04875 [Streptomyces sp. NPDC002935]|uniref:hypothetical protein n=1 Tax=Streptomyces sp. NPDC002935 TaxID=3154545 RepID=UPI0033A74891